jgi:hypothetical protein
MPALLPLLPLPLLLRRRLLLRVRRKSPLLPLPLLLRRRLLLIKKKLKTRKMKTKKKKSMKSKSKRNSLIEAC